jgi:hypothetical protein
MVKAAEQKRFKLRWLLALPLVLLMVLAVLVITSSGLGVDANNPPKFIQADFVDLSRIYDISKFRSLAGHDFSGNGETCRSMKHYFEPQQDQASMAYIQQHNGIPAPPDGTNDIPIYSPVDGTIASIGSEHTPIGSQISIFPDNAPAFNVRLFHVWPKPGLHGGFFPFGWGGSHVKAGQQIGVLGEHQGTDVSVQIGRMPWNENFVSYFDVMPDSLFAKYQARGVSARSVLVETKAYRDAHPVTCQKRGEQKFDLPSGYDSEQEDYVHLSGYVPASSHDQAPPPGTLQGPDNNKQPQNSQ